MQGADAVVVVVGNDPLINGRETQDRTTLALPPAQDRLVRAACEAGRRVVLLAMSSYPYALTWAQENVPAIAWTCHGGQETGRAVAEVLLGEQDPTGRLPQTWYASLADLPGLLEYDIIKARRTYLHFEGTPLFPFVWGLRLLGSAPRCHRGAGRRHGYGRAGGHEHRDTHRNRGRPALHARPGSPVPAAAAPAGRVRARHAAPGGDGHRRDPAAGVVAGVLGRHHAPDGRGSRQLRGDGGFLKRRDTAVHIAHDPRLAAPATAGHRRDGAGRGLRRLRRHHPGGRHACRRRRGRAGRRRHGRVGRGWRWLDLAARGATG